MLNKIKLALAGWSFKTFLRKSVKRGVRVGVTFVLGKLAAGKLSALGIQLDPVVLEGTLDAIIWTKLEALFSMLKVKAERSDNFRWAASFL